MKPSSRSLSTALALAGALPFLAIMLAPKAVAGLNTASLFASYGAIIGSFMAGTLWGRAQSGLAGSGVIVASNVLALISFSTLIYPMSPVSLVVQLVLFLTLLAADYRLYAKDAQLRWYWRLRLAVTMIVFIAYTVMLIRHVLSFSP